MSRDVQDVVRDALTRAWDGAGQSLNQKSSNGSRGLSGLSGVAAGAGAAALVPLAVKGAGKLRAAGTDGLSDLPRSPREAVQGLGSKLGDRVGDKVSEKIDDAGGPSGILKKTAKDALPFGGGGDGDEDEEEEKKGVQSKGGEPGVGKGRRMPVQQSMDIGAPLQTVYNQFTEFEDWPQFMHRVKSVSKDDDCTVSFTAKIWGISRQFSAQIETMRPDQRIKWKVNQGMTHTGVATFHELGPNLTRVLVGMDVEPGGMLEKFARGARNIKRAARADLHRFKAYVEMNEPEADGWRGVIEEGEVTEQPGQQGSRQSRGGSSRRRSRNDESGGSSESGEAQSGRSSSSSGRRTRSSSGRQTRSSSSRQTRSSSGRQTRSRNGHSR